MRDSLKDVIGPPTGKYGAERAIFGHNSRPDLLVKVEYAPMSPQELKINRATTNIFRSIFPKNFAKIFRSELDLTEDKGYSVVRKVSIDFEGFGPRYRAGKQLFLEQVGTILREDEVPHAADYFDFNGDRPNILIDQEENPVYIDKINPRILEAIDEARLNDVIKDPRKQKILLKMIKETIELNKAWQARKQAIDVMLGLDK